MGTKTALKQLKLLEKYGHQKKMRLAAEGWPSKFQTLVSIILSARTKDETTIKIASLLFKKYPIPEKLAKANLKDIENLIRPVNFYKNKSKSITNCSKVLVKKHNSKIPENVGELLELPGVGRKTANVFLAEQGEARIGVDTHVYYISRYLEWSKNKYPHKVEEDLEKLFPKNYWGKVNPILVRFGKTYTSKKEKNKILDEINKVKRKE